LTTHFRLFWHRVRLMPKDGHTLVSGQANKSDQPGEFSKFTTLLDKLLSVPHSKIKAELEAEKTQPKAVDWSTNRAKRRHAYRDVSDGD